MAYYVGNMLLKGPQYMSRPRTRRAVGLGAGATLLNAGALDSYRLYHSSPATLNRLPCIFLIFGCPAPDEEPPHEDGESTFECIETCDPSVTNCPKDKPCCCRRFYHDSDRDACEDECHKKGEGVPGGPDGGGGGQVVWGPN